MAKSMEKCKFELCGLILREGGHKIIYPRNENEKKFWF